MPNKVLTEVAEAILEADTKQVRKTIKAALGSGISAETILEDGIIRGLEIVGDRFQNNEYFVADMIASTNAAKSGISLLNGTGSGSRKQTVGKVIIGTVEGDIHDIGKNLVIAMLRSYSFEVVDLGVNVSADSFIDAVKRNPDAAVVGLSALLTTTTAVMREIVEALANAYPARTFKIMVGGAPVSQMFAEEIGADAYTSDAVSAAKKALEFVQLME